MDKTEKLIQQFIFLDSIKSKVLATEIPVAVNPPPRGAVFPGPVPGPFPGQECSESDSDEECKKKILKETEKRLERTK